MNLLGSRETHFDRVILAVIAARGAVHTAQAGTLGVMINFYVREAADSVEAALKAYVVAENEETGQLVIDRCNAFLKVVEETTEGFKKLRVVRALECLQIRINSAKHSDPCPLNLPAVQAAIENAGALKRQWEANPTDETAQAVIDACQNARDLI